MVRRRFPFFLCTHGSAQTLKCRRRSRHLGTDLLDGQGPSEALVTVGLDVVAAAAQGLAVQARCRPASQARSAALQTSQQARAGGRSAS
jgi:hypothetical protein